ncbi:MAG TPA: hypothetical protein VLJ13_09475, partial [Brevundimonas sp.]|nr:hypothetical protein [Brevundimonas sp.]
QISREEFAAPMNDRFGRLDKDGDGRLSTEELAAGHGGDNQEIRIRRSGGGPDTHHFELRRPMSGSGGDVVIRRGEGDVVRRVERFDLGGGGADHSVILRERSPGSGERHAIRELRRDGDREGGESRFKMIELDGPGGDRALDADNDGRLSEAEFTAPLREAFARMDADRSGFVEEGERGGDGDVRVFRDRIETPGSAGD